MSDDTVASADTATLGNNPVNAGPHTAAAQATNRGRARPPGWGADLAPNDRPAVPMERSHARLEGVHWDTPEQQLQHVEVLCSVERPGITPVFGTSLPPRGVSGKLRKFAFRFSENDMRHWMLLLVADRINVGEGVVSDLLSGRVPNVPAEMGIRAELRHNPRGAARKVGVIVGVLAVVYIFRRRNRNR